MLSLPSSVPSQPEPHNIRRLSSGLLAGHGVMYVGTGLIREVFSVRADFTLPQRRPSACPHESCP